MCQMYLPIWLSHKPPVLAEAAKAKRTYHPALLSLILLLFSCWIPDILSRYGIYLSSDRTSMLFITTALQWLTAIAASVVYLCFVLFAEKRSLRSTGMVRGKALRNFIIFAAALILLALVRVRFMLGNSGLLVLEIHRDYGISPAGLYPAAFAGMVFLALSAWALSLARYGFFLSSLSNRISLKNAVVLSCTLIPSMFLLLGLLPLAYHFTADGLAALLGVAALSVFARFLGVLVFLRFNNIWTVSAVTIAEIFFSLAITSTESVILATIYFMLLAAGIILMYKYPFETCKNDIQGA